MGSEGRERGTRPQAPHSPRRIRRSPPQRPAGARRSGERRPHCDRPTRRNRHRRHSGGREAARCESPPAGRRRGSHRARSRRAATRGGDPAGPGRHAQPPNRRRDLLGRAGRAPEGAQAHGEGRADRGAAGAGGRATRAGPGLAPLGRALRRRPGPPPPGTRPTTRPHPNYKLRSAHRGGRAITGCPVSRAPPASPSAPPRPCIRSRRSRSRCRPSGSCRRACEWPGRTV